MEKLSLQIIVTFRQQCDMISIALVCTLLGIKLLHAQQPPVVAVCN